MYFNALIVEGCNMKTGFKIPFEASSVFYAKIIWP